MGDDDKPVSLDLGGVVAGRLDGVSVRPGYAQGHQLKRATIVLIVVALAWFAWRGSDASKPNDEQDDCVRRGVAYFKEIEAYPKLSDGRSAEAVAQERCGRTSIAFP